MIRFLWAAAVAAPALAIAALAIPAASASTASVTTYVKNGAYDFASNTGGAGPNGTTYWRHSAGPLGYSRTSQTLAADGVDLSIAPAAAAGNYADSGVVVPLGPVKGLLANDGSLNIPAVAGSSNVAVNLFFDTSGDGTYGHFNSDGVYTGGLTHTSPVPAGDDWMVQGVKPGGTVPAAEVTAAENAKLGNATQVWAWAGIAGSAAAKGYVTSVAGQDLVKAVTATPNKITARYICGPWNRTHWSVFNAAGGRTVGVSVRVFVQRTGKWAWVTHLSRRPGQFGPVWTYHGNKLNVSYLDGYGHWVNYTATVPARKACK